MNESDMEKQPVASGVLERDEVQDFAERASDTQVSVLLNSYEQQLQASPSQVTKLPVIQLSDGHLHYISHKASSETIEHFKQECHSQARSGTGPHVCMDCGKSFSRSDVLQVHERIHSGEQPYECYECHENFARSDLLTEHMRLHRGEIFTCPDCGRTFTRADRLRSHALVHNGTKDHKCPQCGRCFSRTDNLRLHMKTHDQQSFALDSTDERESTITGPGHVRQPRGPYTCPTCNRTFPLACRLRAHLRLHSGRKDFTCAECGKQFALAYRLVLHMRIHSGEKPYQCHQCEKSFARRHNLKQHLQSHTGDKPYRCHICGKCYTQTKTLKEHMRLHTGERPFECLTCGKKFARVDNLKVHELTHTDNKRHVCPTCGKKYADIRCFQKHVTAHAQASAVGSPASYMCGICQTGFEDLRSLRSHNCLQHGHMFAPTVDRNYFCGQCCKELTVQMSSHQEIVLSANCNCSGEIDVDGKVDGAISADELDSVIHDGVNVTQMDNTAAKLELPDELLNA